MERRPGVDGSEGRAGHAWAEGMLRASRVARSASHDGSERRLGIGRVAGLSGMGRQEGRAGVSRIEGILRAFGVER